MSLRRTHRAAPVEGTIRIIGRPAPPARRHGRDHPIARVPAPVVVVALGVFLQGCVTPLAAPSPPAPSAEGGTAAKAAGARPAGAAPGAAPVAKPDPGLLHVVPPKRRDKEPPPAPAELLERLVGVPVHSVRMLLGAPARVREEKAATIWTYRAPECELDLYFYMDMATRNLQSLTYDVRSIGAGQDVAPQACVQSIRSGTRTPAT